MTVRQLEHSMSAEELIEWGEFYRLEYNAKSLAQQKAEYQAKRGRK